MCCAGDARIVIADALLAPISQRILVEIEAGGRDLAHILFDDSLVLRGRRGEAGVDDRAFGVDLVTVIQDAARRLGAAMTDAGPRLRLHAGDSGGS